MGLGQHVIGDHLITWLPMGAGCSKANYCGLWVLLGPVTRGHSESRLRPFQQSSPVGSREARLAPFDGWQVLDTRLTAYT